MKNLLLFVFALLPLSGMGQVIQAPGGVNFGNGNLLTIDSGNGAPPSDCRSVQYYVQKDAVGSNLWQCINGVMIHQAGGGSSDVQSINGVIISNLEAGAVGNKDGKLYILAPGVDYALPSGTVANVTGIVAPINGGTGVASPTGYAFGNGIAPYTYTLKIPYGDISGVPPAGVSSVFGRNGDIIAASGDYNVSQITGAAPILNPSFQGTVTAGSVVISGLTPGKCIQTDSSGAIISAPNQCMGGFANPMTAAGDLIIAASNGTPSRLPGNTSAVHMLFSENASVATWLPISGDGPIVAVNNSTLNNPTLSGTVSASNLNGVVITGGNNGINVGTANTCSGNYNLIFGNGALKKCTSGSTNVAIGAYALLNLTNGNGNIAIGTNAGSGSSLSANNISPSNSIYIGADTTPLNSSDFNEIIIGNAGVGHGSNTITWGSSGNTDIYMFGNANISGHLNQSVPGNFAGSCSMNGTTCTFQLVSNYATSALCFANVQGSNPITGACKIVGKIVTITAATTNTEIWGAMLVGNPY